MRDGEEQGLKARTINIASISTVLMHCKLTEKDETYSSKRPALNSHVIFLFIDKILTSKSNIKNLG